MDSNESFYFLTVHSVGSARGKTVCRRENLEKVTSIGSAPFIILNRYVEFDVFAEPLF
jgi:hypothetical protein